MQFTAEQIAEALEGKVDGNAQVAVNSVSKIEDGKPGTLSFLANPKYIKYIYETNASIVIVNADFVPEKPVKATLIRVKDAYTAFATLLNMYEQAKPRPVGIDKQTSIDESAKLGKNVYVGSFAVISKNTQIADDVQIHAQVFIGPNVTVGKGTILYPGVKIYENCKIGSNVIIHAGTVVGSDGFGFAPRSQQEFMKVPQIGSVIIEDFVEIGANVTIDRATMGNTIICEGVKLDNLIQVAHNVEIGENTVIAAQTGISGSTKIGKNCMVGGQVGFTGHIEIADETKIGAQSGIANNIKTKGQSVLGSPATDYAIQRRAMILAQKLPEIWHRLNNIERKIMDDEL
ncbi:MAG TPA: UDP-3-O-(3-hydroxymyristoyl)glucosamine N-acyltransferase [Salinivirgaceae bacterium]|nr:UDP-3-O-(3-hydroxymyristoyl)glucosamine N-acyltransferase [Salinivirgaceae bacterium]